MDEENHVVDLESAVPNPRKSIANLRGSAYDLNSAIADLIDNAIEAQSRNIRLNFDLNGGWITILDDGLGMDTVTHRESMKLASETREYHVDNLGKFGSGMKAASLSLGKSLTVATKSAQADLVTVRRLDEDHVADTNDWAVATQVLSVEAVPKFALEALEKNGHGTCIILAKLDKAYGSIGTAPPSSSRVMQHLEELETHLGLVFHRFIDGSYRGKSVKLYINDTRVSGWDPYCLKADLTEPTRIFPEREVPLGKGNKIQLQGYSLPKKDEFRDDAEHRVAGGPKKWNDSQGFYVYRNGRLIRWGGWLRTRSSDEHTKLARISLDFDGSQDELFSVNIAKSAVELPKQLRDMLTPYIKQVVDAAQERYRSGNKKPSIPKPPGGGATRPPVVRAYRANDLATIIASFLQDEPETLDQLKRAVTDSEPALATQIRWELRTDG